MKKQTPLEKSPLPVLTERLRSLFLEKETQDAFASRVGLVRNTIGGYYNGNRIPETVTLRQICERCNVSADWLLGLSDVKTPDADMQAMAKWTKLLPDSLNALKEFDRMQMRVLNCILTNNTTLKQFKKMLRSIKEAYEQYNIKNSVSIPKNLEEFFYDAVDVYKIIAGRCIEKIVDEIIDSDEPLWQYEVEAE